MEKVNAECGLRNEEGRSKRQNSEIRIQESEEMLIAEWENYTIIVIFNIC